MANPSRGPHGPATVCARVRRISRTHPHIHTSDLFSWPLPAWVVFVWVLPCCCEALFDARLVTRGSGLCWSAPTNRCHNGTTLVHRLHAAVQRFAGACVCVRARACVCVCARACVCVCVCVCVFHDLNMCGAALHDHAYLVRASNPRPRCVWRFTRAPQDTLTQHRSTFLDQSGRPPRWAQNCTRPSSPMAARCS